MAPFKVMEDRPSGAGSRFAMLPVGILIINQASDEPERRGATTDCNVWVCASSALRQRPVRRTSKWPIPGRPRILVAARSHAIARVVELQIRLRFEPDRKVEREVAVRRLRESHAQPPVVEIALQ